MSLRERGARATGLVLMGLFGFLGGVLLVSLALPAWSDTSREWILAATAGAVAVWAAQGAATTRALVLGIYLEIVLALLLLVGAMNERAIWTTTLLGLSVPAFVLARTGSRPLLPAAAGAALVLVALLRGLLRDALTVEQVCVLAAPGALLVVLVRLAPRAGPWGRSAR